MPERSLLKLFARGLNTAGVRYMVTGSVAAMTYGEPRLTNDVDLVVALRREDIPRLIAAFPLSDYYCPPDEIIGIEISRQRRGHFNLIHHESGLKADLYLCGDDPLHVWGMAHINQIEIDGDTIPMAPPEYVIVRKLEYFKEGGSEKHLRDIRSMLNTTSETLRRHELERFVNERGLDNVWAQAQE